MWNFSFNKDQSIKDFKDGTAQYIIAHLATLKYGVTLTNRTYVVYYSMATRRGVPKHPSLNLTHSL